MKKIINSEAAPKAIGPYSQAIQIGNTLYVSGQVPVNVESGKIESDNIEGQTEQVMKNIKAILIEAGFTFDDVVKTTCLLSEMTDFAGFNAVYETYFNVNPPARATFAVKELPLKALVEVDAIAVRVESTEK